mmetsp:Transcript_6682/g.12076  ORF Transcript_6682/g.12076 Transcript_6682/m.12076 type:complete len:291 (-) Transcript_6682:581-1453(-)
MNLVAALHVREEGVRVGIFRHYPQMLVGAEERLCVLHHLRHLHKRLFELKVTPANMHTREGARLIEQSPENLLCLGENTFVEVEVVAHEELQLYVVSFWPDEDGGVPVPQPILREVHNGGVLPFCGIDERVVGEARPELLKVIVEGLPWLWTGGSTVDIVRLQCVLAADVLPEAVRYGLLPHPHPPSLAVVARVPVGLRVEGRATVGVGQREERLKLRLLNQRHATPQVVKVEEVRPVVHTRQLIHVVLVGDHERAICDPRQCRCKLYAHPNVVEPAVPGLKGNELVGNG